MAATATGSSLRWPLHLLVLILLLALAYMLVRIFITLTNPESFWQNNDITLSSPIAKPQTSRNFSFTSDPFNRANADIIIDEEVINQDVPETTLNLKMTGRISGEQGSAILRTSDNKEVVYKVGDEVISDVFVKAVNKDFVVLSVNGQLQRLTFEQSEEGKLSQREASARGISPETPILPNSVLNEDMFSLMQNVSLRRSMKNGRLEGYKVRSNRPDIDISKFGFEKGDIITQVGGKNLTKGRIDFLTLMQQAAERGQVDITVLRNGQSQKIRLGNN